MGNVASPVGRARRVDADPSPEIFILVGPGPKMLNPRGPTCGRFSRISKFRDM